MGMGRRDWRGFVCAWVGVWTVNGWKELGAPSHRRCRVEASGTLQWGGEDSLPAMRGLDLAVEDFTIQHWMQRSLHHQSPQHPHQPHSTTPVPAEPAKTHLAAFNFHHQQGLVV